MSLEGTTAGCCACISTDNMGSLNTVGDNLWIILTLFYHMIYFSSAEWVVPSKLLELLSSTQHNWGWRNLIRYLWATLPQCHSASSHHPFLWRPHPKFRQCQNEPSVTAIKKVLYYLIDIINITNYICGNQQQRFKINYVTTDISAEQQNKASLLSCFVLCFFFPLLSLSCLTFFRCVILSRRPPHQDTEQHPCQTRMTLRCHLHCIYGSIPAKWIIIATFNCC